MTCVHTFEIKIAVIGNVSAGKTTILNALFRDKFSPVSMKRTTAGVNFFRVFTRRQEKGDGNIDALNKNANEEEKDDWSVITPDKPPRTADSTLLEISEDNQKLRESSIVQEKSFDIELPEDLVEMRSDTQLIFVDIPGINEAGSSEKYKSYVEDNWHTFDCVVLVMDARQGVNTEDQVALLELAKKNCDAKREIPIIILCNKVDDPEDDEICALLKEIQEKVKDTFKLPLLEKEHICKLMKQQDSTKDELKWWTQPFLLPLAAVQAFTFRCASLQSFEQFRQFDQELVDKIGRERLGRQHWRKLADKIEARRAVYDLIMDKDNYDAAIEESNFDTFLMALDLLVGGKANHYPVIERQFHFELGAMSSFGKIAAPLYKLFRMHESLDQTAENHRILMLSSTFCRLFDEKLSRTLVEYEESANHLAKLVELMDELQEMDGISVRIGAREMQMEIRRKGEELVRRQIGNTTRHFQCHLNRTHSDGDGTCPWYALTVVDWSRIIRNILQVSHHPVFWSRFGREIRELELLYSMTCTIILEYTREYAYGHCPCKGTCDGELDFNRCCTKCSTWIPLEKVKNGQQMSLEPVKSNITCSFCNKVLSNESIYCSSCHRRSKACNTCGCNIPHSTDGYMIHGNCSNCVVDDDKVQKLEMQLLGFHDKYCCVRCDNAPLDFNRRCKNCKVFYCLPGSMKLRQCPSRLCEGTLSMSGQCSKCNLVFQELSGSLESLLSVKDVDGVSVPESPELDNYFFSRLDITDALSNPNHFGHLAWRFCVWMESTPLTACERNIS